jgi:site-specific DNA recombinase
MQRGRRAHRLDPDPATAPVADPGNVTLLHKSVPRWNLPDGWVISSRPAHPTLVSEDNFVAAQDINAARGPVPQDEPVLRRYLLAGLLACGVCGRRMESAWSNARPAYRCLWVPITLSRTLTWCVTRG